MRYALIARLGIVTAAGMGIAGLGAGPAAATAKATGHPVAIAGRAEPCASGLWVLGPDRSVLFHLMLRRS